MTVVYHTPYAQTEEDEERGPPRLVSHTLYCRPLIVRPSQVNASTSTATTEGGSKISSNQASHVTDECTCSNQKDDSGRLQAIESLTFKKHESDYYSKTFGREPTEAEITAARKTLDELLEVTSLQDVKLKSRLDLITWVIPLITYICTTLAAANHA